MGNAYSVFQKHFMLFAQKRPDLVVNTLSNIFTMRLIGNKTHGDLAEVGMAEFIHQFMYNYDCKHVGKELFRAKEHEEDIVIIEELENTEIPVSLKAYGDGPLQLSTDKDAGMFPKLCTYGNDITKRESISEIFSSPQFQGLFHVNVMPLIYREESMECNILVFDFSRMLQAVNRIVKLDVGERFNYTKRIVEPGKGRSHPVFIFLDCKGQYICEVRYGGTTANALQRGFWTHTVHAAPYFNSLTNGWISYKHRPELVKLIRLALNASEIGHRNANDLLQQDVQRLFQQGMP